VIIEGQKYKYAQALVISSYSNGHLLIIRGQNYLKSDLLSG